ncbi:MAG TPA: thiopeptide-type bacteriocin biosynthesis protein [Ktedonobacteraceae bacterium]|nr:thiopeptide-type bacteriocin biosynthesis protein [Ktedonobacteraceae bacterium]
MRQPAWVCAHLFYYDNLSTLLTGCVKPVVEICRARELITTYFFVRYWEGGPHIRLRLLPASIDSEKEIRAVLAEASQQFFGTHPSQTSLDAQQYEKATGTLTQLIYGEGRQMPLQPADSLCYVPYQPEYDLYGGVEAMPHVEKLFMHSSDIALELLAEPMSKNSLTGQAMSMILLTAARYEPDMRKLAPGFSSHLNSWHRMPAELRTRLYSQFARQYQRQRERLCLFARQLLEKEWPESQEHMLSLPPLARWRAASADTYQTLRRLEQAGKVQGGESFEPLLSILFRCLHMHNNRMGIVLSEEAYVFFLVRQVIYELAGLSLPENEQFQTEGGTYGAMV